MSEFNQLCVLRGTIMPEGGAEELEKFFKEQMGVTVKFETHVLGNGGGNLYTEEFLEKYPKSW